MRSTKVCKQYHVFGRVQGVWYRASARDEALKLGLSGWIRNCRDGSVETVACGTPDALASFKSWLQEGPPAARVDHVEEADVGQAPEGEDFTVTS